MEHIKDLQTNFLRADAISDIIQEYSAQITVNVNRQINAYLYELVCSYSGDREKLKVGDVLYPSSVATTPLGKIASVNYTTGTFQLNTTQYSASDIGQTKYLYYRRSSKDSGANLTTPIIIGSLDNYSIQSGLIIGQGNKSTGSNTLISGQNNIASGSNSHAEGAITTASGQESHAEGTGTNASGKASHAEGFYTKASGQYQHVSGKFNVADSTRFAFIIGNGTNYQQHNAFAITWNGELVLWDSSNNEVVLTADNLRDLIALLPTT